MKKWSVTSVTADLDAFWKKVEDEGPQIVRRRGIDFVCASKADFEARMGRGYKFAADCTHEFPSREAEPETV